MTIEKCVKISFKKIVFLSLFILLEILELMTEFDEILKEKQEEKSHIWGLCESCSYIFSVKIQI